MEQKKIVLTPEQFFFIHGGIDKVLAKVAEIIEREKIGAEHDDSDTNYDHGDACGNGSHCDPCSNVGR